MGKDFDNLDDEAQEQLNALATKSFVNIEQLHKERMENGNEETEQNNESELEDDDQEESQEEAKTFEQFLEEEEKKENEESPV